MKIAMFSDTYEPQVSGVATSLKILSEELIRQGHEVYIFTTSDPDANDSGKFNIYRIASIPFLFFTDRRVVIGGMQKAYHICKKLGIELVHTHTEFGMGLIGKYVSYRLKIPSVHTYHTMYDKYLHYIANGRIVKPNHVKALSTYFCNATSGIIAPGETMAKILKNYQIDAPIVTIPTGVPIPKLDFNKRSSLRNQFGYSDEHVVLLSLSRLSKEKSIDNIIAAMPDVVLKNGNARLLIVGDGPARNELTQQVESLNLENVVHFAGEVSNDVVHEYYQMADIYVNASETETQGLTYLEALVNRLPVIAKSNDYLSQLIHHDKLGKLYEHSALLSQTIIDYIHYQSVKKDDHVKLDNLLYEISSELFGKRVIDFYSQAKKRYDETHRTEENPKLYLNRKYFKNLFSGKDEDKI